jgi:hypothetical protein
MAARAQHLALDGQTGAGGICLADKGRREEETLAGVWPRHER